MSILKPYFYASVLWSLALVLGGCEAHEPNLQGSRRSVVVQSAEWEGWYEDLAEVIGASKSKTMMGPGTVSVLGGARFKLMKTGTHILTMSLPQMIDSQVPVSFCVRSTPSNAVAEYRVERRDESNDILSVKLKGDRGQEVQLDWTSVVFIGRKHEPHGQSIPDMYQAATACVQADSPRISELAKRLWPDSGKVDDYARNIQRFIQEMKQSKMPRSLDALGILDSGMNTVCTANANLALALMRAKGIPSRSMAVIPPISRRLEMHRIVEYESAGQTFYFDPSSLHADVPIAPWQTVIMAKSTVADENLSMKPRMGTALGCPYGQEAELPVSGVVFSGQDFFWTTAMPLAEFDPSDAAVSVAKEAWTKFLNEGVMRKGSINAVKARNSEELIEILRE
jgi:hypothetical protein